MQCLFRFHYPRAVHVSLLGDFNRWATNSTPMCRREDGTWEAAVELPPGTHRYCYFVVDDGGEPNGEDGVREDVVGRGGATDVAGGSYRGQLGIINLGSELCVPEEEARRPDRERMELLN
ncbi:MAG TPA: hypothetical protein VFB66_24800 [Tepidisphaeraceae bacterium]|nr:hypothetical protein [Tepidisphaeraceae bacterium]